MVKILRASLIVLPLILVTSCSSTKFTEYEDGKTMQGTGGAVRIVDGIEIWTDGSPFRKFKVIGVISHSAGPHPRGLIGMMMPSSSSPSDSQLAKAAKAHGGDAVVIVQHHQTIDDSGASGGGTDMGDDAEDGSENFNGNRSGRHGHSTKMFVIKYVE
jgi:hypothetical protein